MTVTVLLTDDDDRVRAGLRALLAPSTGIRIVGEAASGEEAVELAQQLRPDVVLCDLHLGEGMDGVATTRALRAQHPPPTVLILTAADHDADILRTIEAGAVQYLFKDMPPGTIVRGIHEAAGGGSRIRPEPKGTP